jgi:hypothetical protein
MLYVDFAIAANGLVGELSDHLMTCSNINQRYSSFDSFDFEEEGKRVFWTGACCMAI